MNPWWVLWALAVVAFLVWLARWALGEPLARDRIIAAARDRTEPLIGTAVQDECELLWNLPVYDPDGKAGYERLDEVVREHREEDS